MPGCRSVLARSDNRILIGESKCNLGTLRINVNKGFEKSKSKATEKNTIFHRTGMRPGVLKLTGRLSCTELGERD
jgi:hypothetical protein